MIRLIAVGKIKKDYLKEGIDDYLKRINKYHKMEIIELEDSDIEREKKDILKHLNLKSYIIILEINGKEYSSIELSKQIDNLLTNGKSDITFIIGGSDGLDEEIKKMSNLAISFSKLTFPHQLFRLIFLEQLYRSFKILNNETYHK